VTDRSTPAGPLDGRRLLIIAIALAPVLVTALGVTRSLSAASQERAQASAEVRVALKRLQDECGRVEQAIQTANEAMSLAGASMDSIIAQYDADGATVSQASSTARGILREVMEVHTTVNQLLSVSSDRRRYLNGELETTMSRLQHGQSGRAEIELLESATQLKRRIAVLSRREQWARQEIVALEEVRLAADRLIEDLHGLRLQLDAATQRDTAARLAIETRKHQTEVRIRQLRDVRRELATALNELDQDR